MSESVDPRLDRIKDKAVGRPEDELEQGIRPSILLQPAGLSNLALFVLACALGVTVFFFLGQRPPSSAPLLERTGQVSPEPVPQLEVPSPASAAHAEPILETPPAPPAPVVASPAIAPEPVDTSPEPVAPVSTTRQGPLNDPALVINAATAEDKSAGDAVNSGEIQAGRLRNPSTSIAQGTLIRAVLETPIDSTRPGLARALVARDVLSFDGKSVLIPRGSRLIGEFQADAAPGQKRAMIMWTQLIRPDGVTMALASPAADRLGRGGVAGKVNNHFFERFGGSILQSILTVGVTSASRNDNSAVVVALPGAIGQAGQGIVAPADVKPSISIKQGEAITIFVARPLDFAGSDTTP